MNPKFLKSLSSAVVGLTMAVSSLAGTSSFAAARLPDANEMKELIRAIVAIRHVGKNPATVDALTELLGTDHLLMEDSWSSDLNGVTNYPILGGERTITINSHIIPNATSAVYTGRFGPDALFEDRSWLESILVHEYLHTTQSYLAARLGGPKKVEPPAWKYQLQFMQNLCATLSDPANATKKNRCEGLEDRIQAEIDLYNGVRN